MYRVIEEDYDNILAMAKISERWLNKELGPVNNFLYFSGSNSSHGPRIKFDGGTSHTQSTKHAPSYTFSTMGAGSVKLKSWMNKKNCPNAFDKNYLKDVEKFINQNIAALLLVWYRKLDENDALEYFHGHITFSELLEFISCEINITCKNDSELHQFCLENNLYRF